MIQDFGTFCEKNKKSFVRLTLYEGMKSLPLHGNPCKRLFFARVVAFYIKQLDNSTAGQLHKPVIRIARPD